MVKKFGSALLVESLPLTAAGELDRSVIFARCDQKGTQ